MEDNTKLQNLQLEQNPKKSLTSQYSFTFSTDPNHDQVVTENIIFCGKPFKSQSKKVLIHDLVFMRYESFNKQQALHSLEFTSSKRLPATGSSKFRSNSSWKHRLLFGLGRNIKPEMELSDMRERQSRRAPKPMFRVVGGGEPAIAGNGGGGRRHWGLFRAKALACFPHVCCHALTLSSHVQHHGFEKIC